MRQFLITAIAALFLIQSCGSPADSIQEQFDTISKEIKAQYAPDRREKSYEPILKEVDGQKVLYGSTTEQAAKDALLVALSEKGLNVLDSMIVLPDPTFEAKTWGVISHSVANVRYEADYSSEMATQLLMGTPVQLLEKRSYWYRIVTPEGYHAWVTVGSLKEWMSRSSIAGGLRPHDYHHILILFSVKRQTSLHKWSVMVSGAIS